jgi:hypothetical protein
MPGHLVLRVVLVVLAVLSAWVAPAAGQITSLDLAIAADSVGLGGRVRTGSWTPLRLDLKNHAAENRTVECRWLLNDYDGDQVVAQRRATLNPQRTESVWLYAAPAVDAEPSRRPWTIQVVDAESGKLLAAQEVIAPNAVGPRVSLLGVAGNAELGLDAYTFRYTQHEKLEVVSGVSLTTLPDRWYGLASLSALIWTNDGGSPADPAVTGEMQQALRQWVRRGGHLVIVLPTIGQLWSSSDLADLMPVEGDRIRRIEDFNPMEIGPVLNAEDLVRVPALVFDVDDRPDVAVLGRDKEGHAYIVAKRYGFGRVTVIGVDLTDMRLRRMGLPAGAYRIWNTVFHWQSPVMLRAVAEDEMNKGELSRPETRIPLELGKFIPALIAMRNTATPALLLGIVLFGLYWLAAGPLAFAALRRRGLAHYSWLAFLAVVLVFSAVTWGGAWLIRPRAEAVAHFSVVDVDGQTGLAHVRSYLSVFVPQFGRAEVAVDPDHPEADNVLASPGLLPRLDEGRFLDPQSYAVDAASPSAASIPVRATAKQFEIDFLGRLDGPATGLSDAWVFPAGNVAIENGWPAGSLLHNLPGSLRNVLIVFCHGDERRPPWVWRLRGDWPAQQVLQLRPPTEAQDAADVLVRRPVLYVKDRVWRAEGFLGQLIDQKPGDLFKEVDDPLAVVAADDVKVRLIEMLTFYDALPPPNFRDTNWVSATVYERALGRSFDRTPLIAGKRIMIIGHLENSALPVPLTLDGRAVDSHGWTVVRWICELQ